MADMLLYDLSRNAYSSVPLPDISVPPDGYVQDPFTRFIQLEFAEDGILESTLRVATLSQVREFEALSYTWGPDKPTENIFLNGYAFEIRRNLWQALKTILSDRTQDTHTQSSPHT